MAGFEDPFDAEVVPLDLYDPTGRDLAELLAGMTAADGTPYLDILLEAEDGSE
ncbi:hypothetical protein [Kitasatospora sp. NPDC001683]